MCVGDHFGSHCIYVWIYTLYLLLHARVPVAKSVT